MKEVEVSFRPSKWVPGAATYDDGSTRPTGRWADECQAPGCDLVAPVVLPPGWPGWLSLSVRAPRITLVIASPDDGPDQRSLVHDQVFWFCSPAHVAAWVATLKEVDEDAAEATD